MTHKQVLLIKFLTASLSAFGLLCAASAWATLRVIGWAIRNCGEGFWCRTASWWIDFWWLPFIVVVLAATVWLRRLFDRMAARPRGS
jgi:hypothetical protein